MIYTLIGLLLSISFYIVYLISPFVGSIRRKILKWDDNENDDLMLIANYHYVDYLKNSESYKCGRISRMTDSEFIFSYILTHLILGIFLAAFIGIAWILILVILIIVFTIKKSLKSIKKQNKTK